MFNPTAAEAKEETKKETVDETKKETKEEGQKEKEDKGYEKKGTTCRNSRKPATYWLALVTAVSALVGVVALVAVVETVLLINISDATHFSFVVQSCYW